MQGTVISLVCTVFNLIGLVAPYTVKARSLLEDSWPVSGQKWDDELPEDIAQQVVELSKGFSSLSSNVIPRSCFKHEAHYLELYMFGDSSHNGFGSVAFPRRKIVTDQTAVAELAFVMGIVRVVTMKWRTFPKLELQDALLVSRIRAKVHRASTLKTDRTPM